MSGSCRDNNFAESVCPDWGTIKIVFGVCVKIVAQ